MFHDFYDIETLERHLMDLSPADTDVIKDYVKANGHPPAKICGEN